MKQIPVLAGFIIIIFLIGCNNTTSTSSETENTPAPSKVVSLTYNITGTYPHDTANFTEGLEFYHGNLLESTGNYGFSRLVETDPKTGKVIRQVKLDSTYFGEGISQLHDTLYQMTYKEHKVFVYTAKDFKKVKELPLNTEGWGMTNDGKNLIVSDGTSNLYFYEPGTFRLLHTQGVTENDMPVSNVNELEYINGFIYANQWQTNTILKINPQTGEVLAQMDLTSVANQEKAKNPHAEVLNGIAYNPETNKIYITGKNWSGLYEIQFQH